MTESTRIALVTGASRGLGLVIAARPGEARIRPRDRRSRSRRARRRGRRIVAHAPAVVPVAGDITDAQVRAQTDRRGPAARRSERARQQRVGAGRDRTAHRHSTCRASAGCFRSTSGRRWSLMQLARAAAGRTPRPDREHHERCRDRGLSRLGTVRRDQGRAGAADPHAGVRAARAGRVGSSRGPGRHANAHASGGVSGRGHLRSTAAGGHGAVLELAVRSGSGQPFAASGSPRSTRMRDGCNRCDRRLHAAGASRGGRTAGGARAEAGRGAPARLARRHRLDRAFAVQRVAAVALTRRPPGRQHQRNAERRAGGTTEDGDRFEVHLSTRLPGNFWVVEVRRPGPVASLPYRDARAGTTFELEGGGRITLLAPYPFVGRLDSAVALVDRGAGACRAGAAVSRTVRQPDSIRLRRAVVARVDVPDGVRHRARQRGDAVGRAAVHPRARDAARFQRHSDRAAAAPHRCREPRRSRTARTRSSIACRRRQPTASTRRGAQAIASSRSARRSCARSRR